MKRSMLFAALALLTSASASHAISLGVVSDKPWYFIGETITLSIVGDSQGATAYGIYGRLVFNGAAVDNVSRTQKTIGPTWIKGSLEAGDTNLVGPATAYAEAFDQVTLQGSYQTATNPIATITLIASQTYFGLLNIEWDTSFGNELDFFGLTSAPGTSLTIIPCDGDIRCTVPEPTTGALLGLGLVALAVGTSNRARPPVDPR